MLSLFVTIALQTSPAPVDMSATANAALASGHAWTAPNYDISLSNVVVPAGGKIVGGGGTIHVPVTAKFGVCLAKGAKAEDLVMTCDLPADVVTPIAAGDAPTFNPATIPDNLPVGIECAGPGVRITDCFISWFGVGIHSAAPNSDPGTETVIRGCNIENPVNIGIDLSAPTDSFIVDCVVARPTNSRSGIAVPAGNGQFGIRYGGAAGYLVDTHVWGSFWVGVEASAPDAIIRGLTVEDSRHVLLRLAAWRIQISDSYLYYPMGVNQTIAIEAGAVGGNSCGNCNISLRIGGNGGYAYMSLLTHSNDYWGSHYSFTIDALRGWPVPAKGANDTLSIMTPVAAPTS